MNQDSVTVERIDLRKTFPVLHLLQALRLGFRIRVLLPCLIAVGCWLFVGDISGLHPLCDAMPSRLTDVRSPVFHAATITSRLLTNSHPDLLFPLLVSLLLDVMVIAFVGTAVAKATAAEFCTSTRVGGIAAVRFSLTHRFGWLLSTALAVGIVTTLIVAVCFAAWFVSTGAIGVTVVSVLWPLVFLLAVLTALAATVCGVSWLLSLGAIGTDQCSGTDALSRGINYVLSHKMMSTVYLVLVVTMSMVTFGLTKALLQAGKQVLENRFPAAFFETTDLGEDPGQQALFYWNQLITELLPNAVHLATLLSGITLMYILLRKAEDAVRIKEMDGAQQSSGKS